MNHRLLLLMTGFLLLSRCAWADDDTTNPPRVIPIHFVTRDSIESPGTIVVTIINDAKVELDLDVHVDSADGRSSKDLEVDLESPGKQSIGVEQGWSGAAGDVYTVKCSGYPKLTYTVPPLKGAAAAQGPAPGGIPIHFNTRPSLQKKGSIVVVITNDAEIELDLKVHVESADGQTRDDYGITLKPKGFYSYGVQQGWTGMPGDVYTIRCHDYPDTTYTVPAS